MSTELTRLPEVPRGDSAGFTRYFRQDFLSGFLVFLIALPLCLGISLASGYPPMAGIFTAVVGSLLATFLSNSELTIKGPAAGLIVIAIGCITAYGGDGFVGGFSEKDLAAYRAALAIGAAAAVLQMLFALFRAGIVGEFFPLSAVHGMLAAIGIIIVTKQFPVVLGVTKTDDLPDIFEEPAEIFMEPLEIFEDIADLFEDANPAIAVIGCISLAIMFLWPLARKKVHLFRLIPAPVVVALVAVPLGMAFDLQHEHSYFLSGHEYELNDKFLVAMPDHMFGMFEEITFPDFSVLASFKAWKWVALFFAIGSLESVLSAKAVDLMDPWKRKTSIDRDVFAVGAGNLCTAMIGGLPMISEIVRSRANIDNGAQTRFAGMWHGVLLLVCVALIPTVLHLLPLAALAAMLVYTGYRLAHPSEFLHVYHIGREQLIIFVSTLIAVLATDLLIGIMIGIGVKMLIHVINGVPFRALFRFNVDVEQNGPNGYLVRPRDAAVFSNWIPFRRRMEQLGLDQQKNILLDVSGVHLIDHSVMDHLHVMQRDFERAGLQLEIVGLDAHVPLSGHEQSARKRGLPRLKRITIYAEERLEQRIVEQLRRIGQTEYQSVSCRRVVQGAASVDFGEADSQVRIEFLVTPEACEETVRLFRREFRPEDRMTLCIETLEVVRHEQFIQERQLLSSALP